MSLLSRLALAFAGMAAIACISRLTGLASRSQTSSKRQQLYSYEVQPEARRLHANGRRGMSHPSAARAVHHPALNHPLTGWQFLGVVGSHAGGNNGGLAFKLLPAWPYTSYHGGDSLFYRHGARAGSNVEVRVAQHSNLLDNLLLGPVPKLIDELYSPDSNLTLSLSSGTDCIDRVCMYAGEAERSNVYIEIELQKCLLRTYQALERRGVLRGFGSCIDALYPLSRTLWEDDLEVVTGIPARVFKPSSDVKLPELGAGIAAVWAIIYGSQSLGLEPQLVSGALVAAFVADRVALRGSVLDAIARIVSPSYRTTVINHEAGHFLVAYLLGNPLQACLLDSWSTMKDGRFNDVQGGTVFYDPELAQGMASSQLTRTCLDRYSIVVMAGIAAEAMVNNKVEGGSSDLSALVQLLSSLDDGKSWNLPRIKTQARWGVAQAFLLLREHKLEHSALCRALGQGASVGEAVMAIEKTLPAELLVQRGFMSTMPPARLSKDVEADAEAETLYSAVMWREKWLGEKNRFTLDAVDKLADLFAKQGKTAEAEPLYRRVLAWRDGYLGPNEGNTLQSHLDLGNVLFEQKRFAEAEPLFRKAYVGQIGNFNFWRRPDDAQAFKVRKGLDNVLKVQGKQAEAEYIYATFEKKYIRK